MIRLPGICIHSAGTVVLAHFRVIGLSGAALKNDDFIGAWACYPCHQYVDTHHDAETQHAFALGVFRTQYILLHNFRLRFTIVGPEGVGTAA